MEENALPYYDAFDGFKSAPNVDEIVRIVLDEQKHSLTEEDRRILRDRENLRNEFHTLQNVHLSNSNASLSNSEELTGSPLWSDLTAVEPSTSKSDVYFVDVEAIEQPSLPTENAESSNTELDNTIANFIQDENVKAEVLRLNQQIRLNAASICSSRDEAKRSMMEKLNLKRKLASIERKIANFSSAEVRVKRMKRRKGVDSADTGHQKRTYFYRFGAPYFKTRDRFPADRNPDLSEIVRTDQPMNIRLPRLRRILSHDAAHLETSILKQLKAKRVEQLHKCLKDADDRRKCDPTDKALTDEIRSIVRTIKETEEITRISATKDWNIPIDFMSLTESPRFSCDDYERIWRLTGSPKLTRGDFSEQEIAELKSLATKYNEQNWDQIASEMSTNRSGFMCFTKYVTMQKKGKNKPWTKEENELLHKLCISMDSVSKSDSRFQFWKNIRCHFPHRSYTQIHSHWTYVLEPRLKKGRFTPDESKLMMKMLAAGKSYKDIAQIMQNRSVVQVRTHLEVALQKEISRGNWTPEEEEKLLQLIEKYGTHDWVIISKELGTRNRSQCRLKYAVYLKNNQRFSVGTRAPKEFWTEEENQLFKELLFKYGTNFSKMNEAMPTKSREQMRHKYHRMKHKAEFQEVEIPREDSRTPKSSWTDEELQQFKQLLMTYGTQYRRIAKFMPTKTAYQLRYKYHSVKNEWNLLLPAASKSVDLDGERNEMLKHIRCNTIISAPSTIISAPSTTISAPFTTISAPFTTFSAPFTTISAPFTTISAPFTTISAPSTTISAPFTTISAPFTTISTPSTTISAPSTTISAPSTTISAPFTTISAPFTTICTPFTTISAPSTTISAPFITICAPSTTISAPVTTISAPSTAISAPCTTISAPSTSLPVTYITEPPKSFWLPEELFENLVPVGSADNASVAFPTNESPALPFDPLSISSANKVELAAPLSKPRQRKPLELSSKYWIPVELEHFKRLLMVHGPDYKKIASIMQKKTPEQLRWKYHKMKKKWNLSMLPATATKAVPTEHRTFAIPNVGADRTKTKSLPQREAENLDDNLTAIILEVSRAPSAPPDTRVAVPADDASTSSAAQRAEPPPPKSSSLKAVWTDDDLKQFKGLLAEYGPQWKKISEIMTGKTIYQLRYKYNCLKNGDEIPSFTNGGAKQSAPKRLKISAPRSVPVSLHSSQPVFVTSEEHSLLFSNSSNLSMFAGSEDGFAGFPDESRQSPLSFANLIPLRRIETFERMELPGSSCEQMIVPERISEVNHRTGEFSEVGPNECQLSANNLDGRVAEESGQTEGIESDADTVVEVKHEITVDEIKEEDRRDEFAA